MANLNPLAEPSNTERWLMRNALRAAYALREAEPPTSDTVREGVIAECLAALHKAWNATLDVGEDGREQYDRAVAALQQLRRNAA